MTLPEQQYLQQVLRSGEEIRWSGRPVPQLWTVDAVMALMGGVVSLAVAIGWLCFAWPRSWELALCSLPVWAGSLTLLSAPWRWCHRQKRSLLLLTNQRVMVVAPGWTGRLQMDGWTLKPGLLKRYTVQEDGSGDLRAMIGHFHQDDHNGDQEHTQHGESVGQIHNSISSP